MGGGVGDGVTVFAADDRGGGELFEHLFVAARVVPVVVGVDDGGQVDLVGGDVVFEGWGDFGRVCGVDDDGVFGGFVGDEVGVVVGAADPCGLMLDEVLAGKGLRLLTHG